MNPPNHTRLPELILAVDGLDLQLTQSDLLGHAPWGGRETIDYEKIEYFATWPKDRLGTKQVQHSTRRWFFDLNRGNGQPNSFYSRMQHEGYDLKRTLRTGSNEVDAREHNKQMRDWLSALSSDPSIPLVYVTGSSRDTEIRRILLDLANGREVYLIHFGRKSQFQQHELAMFANVQDLVKMKAVNEIYYKRPEPARIQTPPTASPAPVAVEQPEPAMGSLGAQLLDALRKAKLPEPLSTETEDSTDPPVVETSPVSSETSEQDPALSMASQRPEKGSSDETTDEEDSPNKEQRMLYVPDDLARSSSMPSQQPALIVIDCANIDVTTKTFYGPEVELTKELRLQWDRLQDWVDDDWGQKYGQIVPVLQDNGGENLPFANYLASVGFHPTPLIEPQDGRSVDDEAIIKLLKEMKHRIGDVVVISNDGDYFDTLCEIHEANFDPKRRIIVVGFLDRMNSRYLTADFIEVLDLERDLDLFLQPLPDRHIGIEVDDFDAASFLDKLEVFASFAPQKG